MLPKEPQPITELVGQKFKPLPMGLTEYTALGRQVRDLREKSKLPPPDFARFGRMSKIELNMLEAGDSESLPLMKVMAVAYHWNCKLTIKTKQQRTPRQWSYDQPIGLIIESGCRITIE